MNMVVAQERENDLTKSWTKEYEKFFVPNGGNVLENLLLNNYTYNEIANFFQEAFLIRLNMYGLLKDDSANQSDWLKIRKAIHNFLKQRGEPTPASIINQFINDNFEYFTLNKNKYYTYSVLAQESKCKHPLWRVVERGVYEAIM